MVMVAELIREAALEGVREELPHSLAVVVEEMKPRPGKDLIDIFAVMYVERPSQKAIVIGSGGARLRDVGTRARKQAEGCSEAGSTSICGSRSPRIGSAIPPSCAGSGSEVTAEAGYSGTPLAKKLGIKDGAVLALIGAPARWSVPDLPAGVKVRRARSFPTGSTRDLSVRDVGRPTPATDKSAADVTLAFCRLRTTSSRWSPPSSRCLRRVRFGWRGHARRAAM